MDALSEQLEETGEEKKSGVSFGSGEIDECADGLDMEGELGLRKAEIVFRRKSQQRMMLTQFWGFRTSFINKERSLEFRASLRWFEPFGYARPSFIDMARYKLLKSFQKAAIIHRRGHVNEAPLWMIDTRKLGRDVARQMISRLIRSSRSASAS